MILSYRSGGSFWFLAESQKALVVLGNKLPLELPKHTALREYIKLEQRRICARHVVESDLYFVQHSHKPEHEAHVFASATSRLWSPTARCTPARSSGVFLSKSTSISNRTEFAHLASPRNIYTVFSTHIQSYHREHVFVSATSCLWKSLRKLRSFA